MPIADKPVQPTDAAQPTNAALVPKSLSEKPPGSSDASRVKVVTIEHSDTLEVPPVDYSIFATIDSGRTPTYVRPLEPGGVYSDKQVERLWDREVAANGGKPLAMAKGYYEVRSEPVDNPNGILASSTDSPMKLKTEMSVKNVYGATVKLPAGTELPAGVELSPKSTITENDDKTRSITGADLKVTSADHEISIKLADGSEVEIGNQTIAGKVTVADGAKVPAGAYTIARDSVDPKTGESRVDAYYNKNEQDFRKRWQEVPGKPGVYSPAPSQMGDARELIQVPKGFDGKITPNYGGYRDKPVDVKEGDFIVIQKDADGKVKEMYRVEEGAAVETYAGIDDAGKKALADSVEKIRDLGGTVIPAASTGDEFKARELATGAAAGTADAAKAADVVAKPDVHAHEGETAETTKLREALDTRTDIPEYQRDIVRSQIARLADPVQRAELAHQIETLRSMSEAEKQERDENTRHPGWTGMLSLSPQALDLLATALGI